jgi:hypothetical protein
LLLREAIIANSENNWKDMNTQYRRNTQFLSVTAGSITTVLSGAQGRSAFIKRRVACVTGAQHNPLSMMGQVPRFAWHTPARVRTPIQMTHLSCNIRILCPPQERDMYANRAHKQNIRSTAFSMSPSFVLQVRSYPSLPSVYFLV